MAEGQDYQVSQLAGAQFSQDQWAQWIEAQRRAALSAQQRAQEDIARLQALQAQPYLQQPAAINYVPDQGTYRQGGIQDQGSQSWQYADQLLYDQLNYATATPTPYTGPTTQYNPYTNTYFTNSRPVGHDIGDLGRAGDQAATAIHGAQFAGQPAITYDPSQAPQRWDNRPPTIAEAMGQGYRLPVESQGRFQFLPGQSEEERRLTQLAVSGQAGPGELSRLARLRSQEFQFEPNTWQRAVSRYYPSILAAVGTAGIGSVGGLTGAGLGAGWGALNAGAQSKFQNPAALLGGTLGGFAGGYAGGQLAGLAGLGPITGGAVQGAAGGVGGTVGSQAATGQFTPVDILRSGVVGGAAGAATGATLQTDPTSGRAIPGSGLPSQVFSGPINVLADTVAPRRRNPYR